MKLSTIKQIALSGLIVLTTLSVINIAFGINKAEKKWSSWEIVYSSPASQLRSPPKNISYRQTVDNEKENGKYLIYIQLRNDEEKVTVKFRYCIEPELDEMSKTECLSSKNDGEIELQPHEMFETKKWLDHENVRKIVYYNMD